VPYSQHHREHPSPTIRDLPSQERPRERLQRYGEQALSTTELLAVIIGSGNADDHALRLAEHLLITFEDLPGLSHASQQELTTVRGIGEVKAARIKAAQGYCQLILK
jgi:DNA repair protein RadC